MHNFLVLFIIFLLYSMIGWVMEIFSTYISTKCWVNRGFLIGPYCPIYGISSIIMIFVLRKYENDILILFVMSSIICSIMEYLTSYLMEKIFKARWWNYSKRKFNINGRICLTNSIVFGFFGVILIKFVNPFIYKAILQTPIVLFNIISIILLIEFIIDVLVTFNIVLKIKMGSNAIEKDYTKEITLKVKEAIYNKSLLFKRMFNAFPNIEILRKKSKF